MQKKKYNGLIYYFYSEIIKGKDVSKIFEELEILGLSNFDIYEKITFFMQEEKISDFNELDSDLDFYSLFDNLTEEALYHFLQFWESGLIDEQDVENFARIFKSRDKIKINTSDIEMIIKGYLLQKR